MFPEKTANNFIDSGLAYAIFLGKLRLAYGSTCVFSANLRNQCFGKLAGFGALATGCSAFLGAFIHLIACITKKKVIGTYAGWIVTMVENTHSIGNGAIVYFPGNPMGKYGSLLEVDPTVTTRIFKGSPKPTISGFFDMLPKAFFEWFGANLSTGYLAFFLTVFSVSIRKTRLLDRKGIAAIGAYGISSIGYVDFIVQLEMAVCAQKFKSFWMGANFIYRDIASVLRPFCFFGRILMVELQSALTLIVAASLTCSTPFEQQGNFLSLGRTHMTS